MKSMDKPDKSSKKVDGGFRKREKLLIKKVQAQMEFYLGDANLSKDRFLKQEFDKSPNGWLNIEVFTRFNLMKKITTDEALIAKALSKSKLIEVSEDKKMVKRKFPVRVLKDTDERTIYVENLPKHADHEWVRNRFNACGKIAYVSIPRFQTTGDIKGFAFVEFEEIECAEGAKQLHSDGDKRTEKVGKFPLLGNKDVQRMRGQVSTFEADSSHHLGKRKRTISDPSSTADTKTEPQTGKRKRTASETEKSPSKKSKHDKENGAESALKAEEREVATGEGAEHDSGVSGSEQSEDEQKQAVGDKKGKKKKIRNKKNKGKKEKRDDSSIVLRVLFKKEWLELREKYIETQKENVRALKETLRQYKEASVDNREAAGSSVAKANKMAAEADTAGVQEKGKRLLFIPNVIIKVQSEVPIKREELRKGIHECGEIAYIDVVNGDTDGFVRCACQEAAAKLAETSLTNHTFSLVQGAEEMKYWDKLVADQEKKLSSKGKAKKRGKTKMEEKVENVKRQIVNKKHVFFEEK